MSDSERIIALHAEQRWVSGGRRERSYILLNEEEALRLENALRLGRTGKLGKDRPVRTATPDHAFPGNPVASTRFVVKSFERDRETHEEADS
jgi:hypothetical protein